MPVFPQTQVPNSYTIESHAAFMYIMYQNLKIYNKSVSKCIFLASNMLERNSM